MGIIQRLTDLVQAWISKLLSGAEDPEVTLDYSYERQRQLLQDVRRGVADVVTAKKRLQMQSDRLQEAVVKLEMQARQALASRREDLARAALERKAFAQQQLVGLDRQVNGLEAQQQKLVESEQRLAAKIEAFRYQKEVIKAEHSAAEAHVRIGEAATGIGEQMADVGLAIERARDRTEQMQARSAALDELVETGALEDLTGTLDVVGSQLDELDTQRQVEDDLGRLRAELAPAPERAALEQGAGR